MIQQGIYGLSRPPCGPRSWEVLNEYMRNREFSVLFFFQFQALLAMATSSYIDEANLIYVPMRARTPPEQESRRKLLPTYALFFIAPAAYHNCIELQNSCLYSRTDLILIPSKLRFFSSSVHNITYHIQFSCGRTLNVVQPRGECVIIKSFTTPGLTGLGWCDACVCSLARGIPPYKYRRTAAPRCLTLQYLVCSLAGCSAGG